MTNRFFSRGRLLVALSALAVVLGSGASAQAASVHGLPAAIYASPAFANVRVSHDSYRAHSEPAIAVNPRNPNNLIAGSKQFTDPQHYRFKIGTYYSINGGRAWHDSGYLPGFTAYHSVSDVSMAFAADGTAYVSVLACDGGICPGTGNRNGIFVLRSTNGGKSWSDPVAVYLDSSGTTFSDKPWVTVNQTRGPGAGAIYVAWNLDPVQDPCSLDARERKAGSDPTPDQVQGGIVVARSLDGGKTFSAPVVVDAFTPEHEGIGAVPAVAPDGTVSVVYSGISCTAQDINTIEMVKSSDGGTTFSAPRAIQSNVRPLPAHLPNGTFRNTTMPAFAISRRTGAMLIAWADMRNGDADIFTSLSTNGGSTWSSAYRVNHDHLRNGKDQFQPALAVAPNGTFSCAWFDRRRDPNNRTIDEETAQSHDNGKTFGRNFRVTARSWDPAIGAPQPEGRTDNTFIGDYQGLAAGNGAVYPLWNDTQNGVTQEIRAAVLSQAVLRRYDVAR